MVERIRVSLKVRSINFNPEKNFCLNTCVLMRSYTNLCAKGLAKV
jgi:hypothetical protein